MITQKVLRNKAEILKKLLRLQKIPLCERDVVYSGIMTMAKTIVTTA